MTSSAASAQVRRSLLVTLLGWLVILGSAALSVISFFSFLMILAGSYGTQNIELSGFLLVVVAPPASLVAGIGLLRRWRWAWLYLVLGLLLAIGWQVVERMRPPQPAVTTTTLPSGVKSTVYHSGPQFSAPLTAVFGGLLVFVLTPGVRREFGIWRKSLPPPVPTSSPHAPKADTTAMENERGWRVGHRGRDCMFYEERITGVWERIDLSGEMLTGRAHHVIYFPTTSAWSKLPEWARDRREEIITRIKSEFREPDYEYANDVDVTAVSMVTGGSRPVMHAAPSGQRGGLLGMLLALLAVAAFMGWQAKGGFEEGQIRLPVSKGGLRRTVVREAEPALFWTCMGIHLVVGAGSLGLAAWLAVQGLKSRRHGGAS
jgi:hypothetical protein